MMNLRRDSKISVFAGIYLAIFSQFIIAGLFGKAPLIRIFSFLIFPLSFPLIMQAANYSAKRYPWIGEAAKYSLVGLLNTGVDLAVLNIEILLAGKSSGAYFVLFKGISFLAGATNSYFWNKYWTFEAWHLPHGSEAARFYSVAGAGIVINVIVAGILVNLVRYPLWISPTVWANTASIIAGLVALLWNFLGYRNFVFSKSNTR